MRVRTGWMLILAFLCSFLLDLGLAATTDDDSSSTTTPSPTPAPASSSTTSSTATTSPGATPSPTATLAPTTSSSSSSSGTSRGTVVAWAVLTMLVAVGLMAFLYHREQNKRRRIHNGESLRQSLSSADAMQTYGQQGGPPGQGSDPIMSSF